MELSDSLSLARALVGGTQAFAVARRECPDFESEAFADFLRYHKLLPWLAPVLDDPDAGAGLDDELLANLAETRARQERRVRDLLARSAEVKDVLSADGIGCLLVKGLYIGERFYGDARLRHQFDMDVLVRPADLLESVESLARAGYVSGSPDWLERRLRQVEAGDPRAPHAVDLLREGEKLDLHWCLRNRALGRIDERRLWRDARPFRIGSLSFDTLSDRDTLAFLLRSIGLDVRRGALRAKHLLDLDRMLRTFGSAFDWEDFLALQVEEGLEELAVNVLVLFRFLWDAGELPELGSALERRRAQSVVHTPAEALALLGGPRHAPENLAWFARAYPPAEKHRPRRWTRRLSAMLNLSRRPAV